MVRLLFEPYLVIPVPSQIELSLAGFSVVSCMASFNPLWMQEGSTNKICDLKATARCRRDEAPQPGGKEKKDLILVRLSSTATYAWLSGETRAPHLIGTRFVL